MPLTVTDGTKLKEVYAHFEAESESAYVCGEKVNGVTQVYAHTPELMPDGMGQEALDGRFQKYADGARFVERVIANQYGEDLAEAVFHNVSQTRPNLDAEVTRGDLELLHKELQELETLRGRVQGDTQTEIMEQVSQVWQAAPDRTDAFRWIDGVTEVQLRGIAAHYIKERSMKFFDSFLNGGKLKLTNEVGNREDNMSALTDFIASHFKGVRPGNPEFGNIANNMLSCLHPGVPSSMRKKMKDFADGAAERADYSDENFSLSILPNGNIHVTAYITVPFANVDGAEGNIDFSKYTFNRLEAIQVSSAELRHDPGEFDARNSLKKVYRIDSIGVTHGYCVPINLT
jgi:hypothetical protein